MNVRNLLYILFANGAPLSDPTEKTTTPQKTGNKYWNRLYQRRSDGTFEDVTERAGLQGAGYPPGVAVADFDNDGFKLVTANGAQWETVSTAGSYLLSSSDKRLHFGLGSATTASVEILWPSGIKQIRNNLNADQFVTFSTNPWNQRRHRSQQIDLSTSRHVSHRHRSSFHCADTTHHGAGVN